MHAVTECTLEKQGLHRWSVDHLCRICLTAMQNRGFFHSFEPLIFVRDTESVLGLFSEPLFVPTKNKRELLGAVFSVGSENTTFISPSCLPQFASQ